MLGRDAGATAPTAEQELLLRAALLDGNDAPEAYRWWRARTDIEHLDEGSYRLLPQLSRNLLRLAVDPGPQDEAVSRRLKGVFRHTWSSNQVTLRLAQSTIDHLAAAGIGPLVLPEVSLLPYYGHVGARPIESLKLLLPSGALPAALPVLAAQGWGPVPPVAPPGFHGALTGIRLDLGDQRLDLVARAIPNCASAAPDDSFWADLRTLAFGLSAARALSAGDELLYVCRRAGQWDEVPSFRWIADAFMVVASGAISDWDRVLGQAERFDVSLDLTETARYLADALGARIPVTVRGAATAARAGWLARVDRRTRRRKPGVLGRLPLLVFAFMQGHRAAPLPRRLAAMTRFLQREWRLGSGTQVAWYLLRGARRMMGRSRPGG